LSYARLVGPTVAAGPARSQHPPRDRGQRRRRTLASEVRGSEGCRVDTASKPFPAYEETVIDGLTDEQEDAFLKAIAEA